MALKAGQPLGRHLSEGDSIQEGEGEEPKRASQEGGAQQPPGKKFSVCEAGRADQSLAAGRGGRRQPGQRKA